MTSMMKHFDSLSADYNNGRIVYLSLIKPNHGFEKELHDTAERLNERADISKVGVDYFHFDFHGICKGNSEKMMEYL